jgi:two-component system, NarL family, nitrate/nitrite response regulator NarL
MSHNIRIIVADDHPLLREGVVRTLADGGDFDIVAECGTADQAFAAVSEHLPDVILLDISMPGGGINAARRISAAFPSVRIVMLTVSENEDDVMEALKAGACSYVLKGIGGNELVDIVNSVHQGGVYVSPSLAARMLVETRNLRKSVEIDPFAELTVREVQILKLVAKAHSNKEIANSLNLSEKTVKHYMTNILQKLQVRNRVEAAVRARDRLVEKGG